VHALHLVTEAPLTDIGLQYIFLDSIHHDYYDEGFLQDARGQFQG
jgi:hypothetical protein